MPKDKNGKELAAGDFVKFKPRADGPFEIGKIAHTDNHHVPKLDSDGDLVQKKKGGVETEARTGQVIYIRGNSTELVYLNETVELVLKANTI